MTLPVLRFFEIYIAVNLHFKNGKYNYFECNGNTTINEGSFLKRRDKYFFEKWKNKCVDENQALELCVSNIMAGNAYIRDFSEDAWDDFLGYRDSLDYRFTNELEKYLTLKKTSNKGAMTTLLEGMLTEQLSKEFMVLFNMVLDNKIYEVLDKQDDLLWHDIKNVQESYSPFIKYLWNVDPSTLKRLKEIAKTKA